MTGCPFCSLGCSGLPVDDEGSVADSVCSWAARGFSHHGTSEPRIKGKVVSWDEAVTHAAQLLEQSHAPLFAGLATDVAGIKGITALAEMTGGIMDHSEGVMVNARVLQSRGYYGGTIHECRNRADVIVVIAPNGGDAIPPRLNEMCLNSAHSFVSKRDILLLGEGLDEHLESSHAWSVTSEQLMDALTVWRMHYEDQPIPPRLADVFGDGKIVNEFTRVLKDSSYATFIWVGGGMSPMDGEMAFEFVASWVDHLNQTQRAICLPLGGGGNGAGAVQVTTWQSGYPVRVSYGGRTIRHEPHLYNTDSLLADGAVDVLMWVDEWETHMPPKNNVASIVVGREGMECDATTNVYLPCATSGVTSSGIMVRGDGASSVYLKEMRSSSVPSVAQICRQLREAMP